MAELADAADSKSVVRKDLWVQLPPSVPGKLGTVAISRNLTHLASLLDSVRTSAAAHSGRVIDRETWRRLLGDRLACKSEPERLHARTLTIVVTSSVWAQELSFLAPEILERLRNAGIEVDTLRWKVGSPKSVSRPASEKARVVPVHQLPTELNQALDAVDDAELRKAIHTAAAHVLGRQEYARRRAIEALPNAQVLQSAEPRTSLPGRVETGTRAESLRTRAKRRG